MISYVVASIRPEAIRVCIESIRQLPPHDEEILVVTPYPETDFENVRYILDDQFGGSTYAVNKGVQNARGDWVAVGTDDHVIGYDVNAFLARIGTPEVQNAEYQVINLGAPWGDNLRRNVNGYGIDLGPDATPEILDAGWPVLTFPAVSKKTINEKLDGCIFHPDLVHHFVDHYLGLFVSRRQANFNFNFFPRGSAWNPHIHGACDQSRDHLDSVMFCKLAAKYIKDPLSGKYTDHL